MAFEHETDLSHFEIKEHACKDCASFKQFKEGCWYFWENKLNCSQKILDLNTNE